MPTPKPAPAVALDATPEAPVDVLYTVQTTLGGGPTWERGQLVAASELAAIPGCDIARLVALGAIAPVEPLAVDPAEG
jgi:hypothetical protein